MTHVKGVKTYRRVNGGMKPRPRSTTSLPETQQGRPTWRAALLVFLCLAPPVWLALTLAEALWR